MASTSFWDYLKNNIANHFKLFGFIGLVVAGYFAYNYVSDLKNRLATQEKTTATLSQQFQKVGTAAVSGNSEQAQPAIATSAQTIFGSQVTSLMAQQNAQIQALASMVATIKASTAPVSTQLPPPTSAQETSTGALTGYPLEQVRPGAPPLTSLNLFYDPTQKNPSLAFKGSTWTNYQEQFNTSVGLWQQQKTGGYKTVVKLTRTITKPDPNDPTKSIVVGTEPLPITGADTIFTPADLTAKGGLVLPRWTLTGGISKTTTGYQPAGIIDYRITSRLGVSAGAVNNAFLAGVSVRLGGK